MYESKFDELMFQFGSFVESIQGHLMECIPSAEELEIYVGRCNRDKCHLEKHSMTFLALSKRNAQ